jgi:hypothetical protein
MVVYGRSQVFKVTTSATVASQLRVLPAGPSGNLGKGHPTPEVVQSCNPRSEFLRICMTMSAIIEID